MNLGVVRFPKSPRVVGGTCHEELCPFSKSRHGWDEVLPTVSKGRTTFFPLSPIKLDGFWDPHVLHEMAGSLITQKDHRNTKSLSQVECLDGEVKHLLGRPG